ncbi:hypothetical protein JCM33374_g3479 [Metschnikowia sp. JCM 33374]|nr:hypothetical protein JCM33374_g3479 [Metschnikowia sp. JCM 33374]
MESTSITYQPVPSPSKMKPQISNTGTELVSAVSSTLDTDALLQKSQQCLNSLACPCQDLQGLISAIKSASTPPQEPVIRLIEVELLLFFSADIPDTNRVESIFKELSYLSTTNSLSVGSSTPLMRIKYNDLSMDYHFLLSPKVKGLRLADLVTKKINVLSLVHESPTPHPQNFVTDHIRHKLLVYYVLCDSDYRKKGVLRYLDAEGIVDKSLSPGIAEFLARREKLITLEEFKRLVGLIKQDFYPLSVIERSHAHELLENHLDANLSKLPNYYTSISLARIERLLLAPGDQISIEDLLCKMITGNKFPYGASIDQISGFVYFAEKAQKYGEFETHIKQVCDRVAVISASIQAQVKQ